MKHYIFLLAAFLGFHTVHAQGWQHTFGAEGDQRAFSMRLTPGGGLVAAGSSSDTVGALTDWYFVETDPAGNLLTALTWGNADRFESPTVLLPRNTGGWVLGGTEGGPNFPSMASTDGQMLYATVNSNGSLGNSYGVNQLNTFNYGGIALQDGILLLGIEISYSANDAFIAQRYATKFDQNNQVVWQKKYPTPYTSYAADAIELPNNQDIIISGWRNDAGFNAAAYVLKINHAGDSLAVQNCSALTIKEPEALLEKGNNELVLVGYRDGDGKDIALFAANNDLDSLWSTSFSIPGNQQAHAAIALPNGDIAIAGEHIAAGSSSRDAFLAVTDAAGNLKWFKTYGGIKGDIFWDIQAATDGNGFVLAGQTASFSTDGNLQAWLARTDSLGNIWSSRLMGQATRDSIENCMTDSTETPLSNWLVRVSGANDFQFYTLTDQTGQYEITIDTGIWQVALLPPSAYWSVCEDSVLVNFPSFGDSLRVDFAVQTPYNCALLDVDITVPFLRRCFDNTYFVRYFNYGPATAEDATVAVVLDPYLTPVTGSLPYTVSGDTLYFSIGAVHSLTGGQFSFTALLDCDATTLGQTHCVEAHIFPDSLCTSFNPIWDGANLEVSGYCAGDSVVLTISNTGSAMQDAVEFVITEDQIIFKRDPLQLAGGQDTTFVLYPNGATVLLFTTQTPGHPLGNQPALLIEGCGSGVFSTGFVLQFPQDDGDPFTDIECRPNIGSFDPNDKIGIPIGTTAEGIIAAETPIEYLIRFQNTGTDTAFRVEIRDTLSPVLDLATFRQGAGSHPYRLAIEGAGVLRFIFDPIALPDSNANLAASMGFVKFSIQPRKNTAVGTPIHNRAAIYFDKNAPVLTNTTLHTIGDPFAQFLSMTTENASNKTVPDLSVQPNPTTGWVHIKEQKLNIGGLENKNIQHGLVEVWNALGQQVMKFTLSQSATLDLRGQPSGIYTITLNGKRTRVVKI